MKGRLKTGGGIRIQRSAPKPEIASLACSRSGLSTKQMALFAVFDADKTTKIVKEGKTS